MDGGEGRWLIIKCGGRSQFHILVKLKNDFGSENFEKMQYNFLL